MFMLLVSVLSATFLAIIGSVAVYSMKENKQLRPIMLYGDIAVIGSAVEQYYRLNMAFPTSLDQLAGTPGFEHIRSFANQPATYGYFQQSGLTTSYYKFNRAATFALNNKILQTSSDYASTEPSTCDHDPYPLTTSLSWCGPKTSAWHVVDNRPIVLEALSLELAKQQHTIRKIRRVYNVGGVTGFPADSPSTATLPSLVGYAGTKAACTGAFRLYSTVVLDCRDLYSHFGQPVTLNKIDNQTITLTASAGTAMLKAADSSEFIATSTMVIQ